ncbi:helix-turn-helix transcriptional regulator [Nocardia terpenica]|nr:helix-turn-helix transcriptional regulator [Nocardia terpenica]MBF6115945.1 helix-turn-helix transcriptional regulator [Nocardia terpenica]
MSLQGDTFGSAIRERILSTHLERQIRNPFGKILRFEKTLHHPELDAVPDEVGRKRMPAQPAAPSVPRRQVARILSKLHKESGLYIKDVAEQVNLHHTTVSKMLKGEPCKLKPIYIDKLCDIYGVSDDARANLQALAADAEKAHGWWCDYSDVMSTRGLDIYVAIESAASTMKVFQSERIPGLLQSEDYARALLSTSLTLTPEGVERNVQARMLRQAVITESKLRLDAILDENVVYRAFADPRVGAGQLRRFIEVAALPNVSIRLVPFDAGVYRGTEDGAFMILGFGESADMEPEPPIVYVESAGSFYFQEPRQVGLYRRSWARIEQSALSVTKTRARLSKLAKELSR